MLARFLESLDPNIKTFCTSLKSELKAGDNFIHQIAAGLKDSEIFLPIISEEYLNSKFCLMELGAAWIKFSDMKKDAMKYILPAVLYPVSVAALLDTPLHDLQTVELASEEGVLSLANSVLHICNLPAATHEYHEKVSVFFNELNELLFITNSGNLLRRARIFSCSESGNPDSGILHSDCDNNVFSIEYSFVPTTLFNSPKFISMVLQFIRKLNLNSVAHAVEKNTCFGFTVDNSSCSIKNISIEFKFGEYNRILDTRSFSVDQGINHYKVNFCTFNQDGWNEVSEICFVLRPTDAVKAAGVLSITNIHIFKD